MIRSNVVLSYLAMLSVAGFLLWVIHNLVRSLRQDKHPPAPVPVSDDQAGNDSQVVDWPVHIFLSRTDDIPFPGRLVSINPGGAFMESSACLKTGQDISLYVDIAGEDQVRLTAKVTWAREGRDGKNAAQLVFANLDSTKKKLLLSQCRGEKHQALKGD